MSLLTVFLFVQSGMFIGSKLAATSTSDCPPQHYWNSTSCTPCSKCGPGYGLKTECTDKQDTECLKCYPGYDYSNTTDMEPCQLCINEDSKCLDGNYKIIKNCTRFSPTVCSGCAEGNFFFLGVGLSGGCVPCSPPCGFFEVETRQCTTEHDRLCIKQWTTKKPLVPSKTVPKTISPPSGTATYETEKAPTEPRRVQKVESQETAIVKQPWFWAVVAGVTVVLVVAVPRFVKWRKRRLNKNKDRQQSIPLVQRGLDTHIRDLTVEDREFISEWLNDQDSNGFCYWEKVAEKLGLQINRYRQWRRADNPTVKLLTALAEDEESTIRKLIKASQEAGLTLFAKELGKRFSEPTNIQNGSDDNV